MKTSAKDWLRGHSSKNSKIYNREATFGKVPKVGREFSLDELCNPVHSLHQSSISSHHSLPRFESVLDLRFDDFPSIVIEFVDITDR